MMESEEREASQEIDVKSQYPREATTWHPASCSSLRACLSQEGFEFPQRTESSV